MAPKGGICRRYVQCTDSRFGALESELPSATQGRGKQHERVRVPMADLQKNMMLQSQQNLKVVFYGDIGALSSCYSLKLVCADSLFIC